MGKRWRQRRLEEAQAEHPQQANNDKANDEPLTALHPGCWFGFSHVDESQLI
jgi:hypothetical protein